MLPWRRTLHTCYKAVIIFLVDGSHHTRVSSKKNMKLICLVFIAVLGTVSCSDTCKRYQNNSDTCGTGRSCTSVCVTKPMSTGTTLLPTEESTTPSKIVISTETSTSKAVATKVTGSGSSSSKNVPPSSSSVSKTNSTATTSTPTTSQKPPTTPTTTTTTIKTSTPTTPSRAATKASPGTRKKRETSDHEVITKCKDPCDPNAECKLICKDVNGSAQHVISSLMLCGLLTTVFLM